MVKCILHILFKESFVLSANNVSIPCCMQVSFMRYDENGKLFFPLSVYSEDDDQLYISMRYRLYPNGAITLTNHSGDCSDDIIDFVDKYLDNIDFYKKIPTFVEDTIYQEIIPAQAY